MQVYKTTPENISNLFTFQISNEEEGILLTNYEFNVFLPNYTTRFDETFTELKEITKSFKDCIDEIKNALTNLTTDIVPTVGSPGSPIVTPTFTTNIQTTSINLDTIKKGLDSIDTKIDEIKEKL